MRITFFPQRSETSRRFQFACQGAEPSSTSGMHWLVASAENNAQSCDLDPALQPAKTVPL